MKNRLRYLFFPHIFILLSLLLCFAFSWYHSICFADPRKTLLLSKDIAEKLAFKLRALALS